MTTVRFETTSPPTETFTEMKELGVEAFSEDGKLVIILAGKDFHGSIVFDEYDMHTVAEVIDDLLPTEDEDVQ